ncbi:Stk1 family PASTA domain-containing Ser/Thr kinase [uncultured Corynebacterium sp.]|uniref:Stk1 family PASTA domain-containing Ser/Thr kinase n=1 Tax=uncultured Corynebacterium sp. TaxID=159447 RepID=UPI0025F36956|nr:Stk1 family PASTA domain-containing Ser/Thr kinase [uncultured Corynebacterium sp.]
MAAQLQAGDLLDGRYRIGATIAHGGMSTVYHCIDTRLDRDLAAKVMDPALAADPTARTRFEREARAVARLDHPCLVNVFDQGTDARDDGELVFLIMELVPGGTLRELLRERGPMPPHAALAVTEPVVQALALAHEEGMVHRDVKPDNVLISDDHQVKLTDFGLVRASRQQSTAGGGPVIGTAAYLSPEQVQGRSTGPQSDVYSTGVMLFELLTGRAPFRGATPRETAAMRLTVDVPAPSTVIVGVPPELDDLVLTATHRDPARRFPDGAALLTAVRSTVRELELPAFRVPVPERSAVHRALAGSVFSDRLSWDDEAMATSMVPPVGADPAVPDSPDRHTTQTRYQAREPVDAGHPTHVTRRVPEPVPAQPGPPLSNRNPARTVLWTVLVLVTVIAVAVGSWWVASGRYGEVPQVLGQDVTGARSAVEQAGFTSTVTEVWSDDDPAESVTGTDPGSGERVVRGTEVAVLVSRGRPTVPEPGDSDTLSTYQAKLRDRSLTWAVGEDVWDDDAPVGVVAAVSPSAGSTVDTGTEVTVRVSKGPRPVKVPGVDGMSADKARKTLEHAGLTVSGTTEEFDTDVDGGDVIGTDPDTGTEVPSGTSVRLVVSSAVTVPDLTGRSLEDAAEALRDAGLNPVTGDAVSDTSEDAGDVAGTSPVAGTRLDPSRNTTVTLHPSDQAKVPFVIGKSAKDARTALEKEGFAVKIDGRSDGRVISQSPGPRSRVTEGATVTVRTI